MTYWAVSVSVSMREVWVANEEVAILLMERERDRWRESELVEFLEALDTST